VGERKKKNRIKITDMVLNSILPIDPFPARCPPSLFFCLAPDF